MTDATALSKMKIAVVDDHELIREGLGSVLIGNGIHEVEKFETATGLLSAIKKGKSYDFYIIDLELPDGDGFELIDLIRELYPGARIIVSTIHDEIWTLRKLLEREVNAIIYKSSTGDDILTAMNEILAGNKYYCDEVMRAMSAVSDNSRYPSSRELEVLQLIAQGMTTRKIAETMFVSDNTIEAHRKALFAKLGAVNVADLIVKAIREGYLSKSGEIRK